MALGNLFFSFFCSRDPIFVQAASKKAKCGSSAAPGRSARGLPDSPTGVECAKMLQVSTLLPPAPSLPTPSSSGASRGGEHARQLPLNGVAPTAKLTTGGVWEAGGQHLLTQPRTLLYTLHTHTAAASCFAAILVRQFGCRKARAANACKAPCASECRAAHVGQWDKTGCRNQPPL